ncbi:uncharacterized protein CBL_21032, partial [Carabus blaptoides fortunei]
GLPSTAPEGVTGTKGATTATDAEDSGNGPTADWRPAGEDLEFEDSTSLELRCSVCLARRKRYALGCEAPEDQYDSQSLYDRLQEQKQKKDLEYEEAHKLKNMIKRLDDDEIEFLDLVDRTKLAAERKKILDEERRTVASLQEKSLDQRIHAEITVATKPKAVSSSRHSQLKLLKGAVVTKAEPKKRKHSESDCENSDKNNAEIPVKNISQTINNRTDVGDKENCKKPVESLQSTKRKFEEETATIVNNTTHIQGALTCIGILPGLGCYNDSSESEVSTDSEAECTKVDMLGRKIKKQEKSE